MLTTIEPRLNELTGWCIENLGRIFQEWDWWWAGEEYRSKYSHKILMKISHTPNQDGATWIVFSFKSEEGLVLFKMRWL